MLATMRRAAKVDGNQTRIVAALRRLGASVRSLAAVGQGVPDLLVGRGARNYLLEVKMPRGVLTPDQLEFFGSWRGQVAVVHDEAEAIAAVGLNDAGVSLGASNDDFGGKKTEAA
jgi:hypothetical protein